MNKPSAAITEAQPNAGVATARESGLVGEPAAAGHGFGTAPVFLA